MPIKPIVITDQEHIFTTSLLVAEKFNKNHRDVLRTIRKLDIFTCFNEFNIEPVDSFAKRNFALSKYQVSGGKNSIREEDMYTLTKEGFLMVAMSFTGKEAALWKIAFINAFNKMEAKLNELLVTEHHSMLADLYARHPQWHLTRTYLQDGLSTAQIAAKQGKHRRNVQRMVARMKASGLYCISQQAA